MIAKNKLTKLPRLKKNDIANKSSGILNFLDNLKVETSPKRFSKKKNSFQGKIKPGKKTAFSKVTENMYKKNKDSLAEEKVPKELIKESEIEFNKLTNEPYLNKFNIEDEKKNKKILKEFLKRKDYETTYKKIGRRCDQITYNIEVDNSQKRIHTSENKNKIFHKLLNSCNLSNNLKVHPSFSKKRDPHLSLNVKTSKNSRKTKGRIINHIKQKESEYEKSLNDTIQDSIILKINKSNDEINNREIKQISVRNDDKQKTKLLTEILNHSFKRNKENKENKENNGKDDIKAKFLDFYMNKIRFIFGREIDSYFEIKFIDFLNLLYLINFTKINYSEKYKSSDQEDVKDFFRMKNLSKIFVTSSKTVMHLSDLNLIITQNDINKYKDENKIDNDDNDFIVDNNNSNSNSDNDSANYENDKEFILSKEAWKIITESYTFKNESVGNSRMILFFVLSVFEIFIDTFPVIKQIYYLYFFQVDNKNLNEKINKYKNLFEKIKKDFVIYRDNCKEFLLNNKDISLSGQNEKIYLNPLESNLHCSLFRNNSNSFDEECNNEEDELFGNSNDFILNQKTYISFNEKNNYNLSTFSPHSSLKYNNNKYKTTGEIDKTTTPTNTIDKNNKFSNIKDISEFPTDTYNISK